MDEGSPAGRNGQGDLVTDPLQRLLANLEIAELEAMLLDGDGDGDGDQRG